MDTMMGHRTNIDKSKIVTLDLKDKMEANRGTIRGLKLKVVLDF